MSYLVRISNCAGKLEPDYRMFAGVGATDDHKFRVQASAVAASRLDCRSVSFTPRFSEVFSHHSNATTVSTVSNSKAVETAPNKRAPFCTSLKRGVNESYQRAVSNQSFAISNFHLIGLKSRQ
jgi:hypothetical protein